MSSTLAGDGLEAAQGIFGNSQISRGPLLPSSLYSDQTGRRKKKFSIFIIKRFGRLHLIELDAQQRASVAHDLLEDISSANGSFELGIRSLVPGSTVSFFLLNFLIQSTILTHFQRKEHWST